MTNEEFRKLALIAHPLWLKCIEPINVEKWEPIPSEQLKIVDKYVRECVCLQYELIMKEENGLKGHMNPKNTP